MTLAIDFDGTIVTHEYPNIGEPVPNALSTLRRLRRNGHKLVLFTMRSGEELQEAVDYLKENGVGLYGVNVNPSQNEWTDSPKAYGHIYIDDAALGVPLVYVDEDRPYVNWVVIESELEERGLFDG